jgi:hypothetical protein
MSLAPADHVYDPLMNTMFTADINDPAWLTMLEESPIRSAKRPRLERSNTTGVLGDVTSMGFDNRRFLSPAKPLFPSPLRLGSPVKLPAPIIFDDSSLLGKHMEGSGNDENEDFGLLNLPSDDSDQIDITQGFHKIGSPSTLGTSTAMQPPSQAFAFPVYPGAEAAHHSPSKSARGKPELSRRSTFAL